MFKDESKSAYMMVKSLLKTGETRIDVHYLNESYTVPTNQSNESLARMLPQKKWSGQIMFFFGLFLLSCVL